MPIGKSGWGMGPTSGEGPWNVPSKAQQAMTEPSDDENNPEAKQHTHHHSPQSPNPNDEDRGNREGMWKHLEELSDSEGTSRQPTSEAEWEKYFDPTSPQPNRPRKRRVYQTHGHGRNKSIGEEQPSASSMQAPEPPKTSRRGLHQLEKEEDKPSEHEDDSDTEENSHHGEPQSQAPGDETHVDRDYHAPPGDRAALLSGEGNRKWKGSLLERDLRDRFSSGGPSRRSAPASDSNPFLAADPNQSNPPPRWVIGEPQLQPSRSEQIAEDMRFQDPRKAPKPPTTPSPYSAAHVHQEQAPALTVDVPELPTVRSLHSDQEQPAKTLSDAPEPPPTRKRGFRSMFGWAKKAFQ
ncbi:hypothetical protein MMC30_003883 [Trapelia coarctata]|nr:hypothetical protein [Trapelia coarctata]